MANNDNTYEPIDTTAFGSYLVALDQAQVRKASEVDQHNRREVTAYASTANKHKQLVGEAASAYHIISGRLEGAIKGHLGHQQGHFISGAAVYFTKSKKGGSLMFKTPSMYFGKQDLDASEMISPSYDALAYEFIMFRVLSKDDCYKIYPNFFISFHKDGREMYKTSDILNSFRYQIGKEEQQAYDIDGKLNSEPLEIFAGEKAEATQIVKRVFKSFADKCMKLKNTEDTNIVTEVCRNAHDFGDPDYTLKMFTCLEVFQLTKVAGFCEQPAYEQIEL